MRILGIETSCDETAASIVEDGSKIISNIVASQVDIHARYGGVVPEIASRQHIITIIPVMDEAMSKAQTSWKDIDGIAVTYGPGLAGSLLVGVNVAKAIALAQGLPFSGACAFTRPHRIRCSKSVFSFNIWPVDYECSNTSRKATGG